MRCPLQARYALLEQRPQQQNAKATFGTCIHKALELYADTGQIEDGVELFKVLWETPSLVNAEPDYWPAYSTYGGLRERGIHLLYEYHEKVKWENRKVIGSEHRFLVPFGDHELEGTVDLIEERKDGKGKPILRIVDYKTNAKAPTKIELAWNIQFTTYVYASLQREFWVGNGPDFPGMEDGEELYEKYIDVPRRAIWFQLMTNKEIDAGKRDDEDFMRLHRVITEIQKAIDKDVFIPSISAEACPWCSYTDLCAVAIKTQAEREEDGIDD